MRRKTNSHTTLLFFIIWCLATIGYFKNVYHFVKADFEPSYKEEIIRGVGIVTGLGCIIGYIPLD